MTRSQQVRMAGVSVLALMVLSCLAHLSTADPTRGKSEPTKTEEPKKDESKSPADVRQQFEEMRKEMDKLRRDLETKLEDQRRAGPAVPSSRLGVEVDRPSKALVQQLGLTRNTGLVLSEIVDGSAAAKAGLKQYDVLIDFNGKPVPSDPREFAGLVENFKATTAVDAVVIRQGKKEEIKGISLPEGRSIFRGPTPAPKGRIAILNLKYVVSNYKKFKTFHEENRREAEAYEVRLRPLTTQMEAWQKQIQDPATDAATKAKIQEEAKPVNKQIQDITEEARAKIGKRELEQLVEIYKEIGAVASAYAVEHDLDLVMHYADGANDEEMQSPSNIQQKMSTRGMVPLYWGKSVDISYPVLQALNSQFPKEKQR